MTCLRCKDDRMNIGCKEELTVRLTIEKEEEIVFWMCEHDTSHRFSREPANAVESVRQQESSVDCYTHSV